MHSLFNYFSPVEIERRKRIRLTLWAYAYEIESNPLVNDDKFDTLAKQIDTSVETGRLDDFWQKEFQPHTGMWIHKHPELDLVRQMYLRTQTYSERNMI